MLNYCQTLQKCNKHENLKSTKMSETSCPAPCGPENVLSFPQTEFEGRALLRPKRSSMLSSCRICLSSIFAPASLTCGHRFCESCLDQYWQLKEKPNFLICPLCRAHAYNIDFTEEDEKTKPNDEFRKNFSSLQQISDSELNKSTLTCFKISMLIPILYYFVKWLKPSIELASLFKLKFWYKM